MLAEQTEKSITLLKSVREMRSQEKTTVLERQTGSYRESPLTRGEPSAGTRAGVGKSGL